MKHSFSLIDHQKGFERSVDFASVADGKNYPSDVDMRIEVNDRLFVEVEFKSRGVRMKGGQRRHFMNANELLQLGLEAKYGEKDPTGYGAYLVVAEHPSSAEVIIPAETLVTAVLYKGEWHYMNEGLPMPKFLRGIANKHDNAKLKRIAANAQTHLDSKK